jgi:DNA recombination protein RmuC
MEYVLIAVVIVFGAIIVVLLRRPQSGADISVPLQNLNQSVNDVRVELRAVAERVGSVEQNQSTANQGIAALKNGLTETDTVAKGIADAARAIRTELARAKDDLTELQTHTRARQELEQRTADSIRRLETVIAGTQSKGAAGENLLEVVFSQLPVEWQVRDFAVGNKVAEFGLRLPNNLVLPIDSKWPGTNLLEQFAATEDATERQKLKSQIESAVLAKAKEVQKYLDPNVTVNFGVAAVPDAVFELCCGVQAAAFQMNVVLISYSLFVPYLLLVFQTILRNSQNIDLHKLEGYLGSAQTSICALQEELEGRFARALTMLTNSRADMSAQLSKLAGGLTSLQIGAGATAEESCQQISQVGAESE